MTNRRIIYCFLLSLCLFLFETLSLKAISANYVLGGSDSVEVNQNITITVNVNNISGGEVGGVAGKIEWDTSSLQLVSSSGIASPFPISGLNSANKFTGFTSNQSGFSNNKQIVTIVFKSLKVGSTTIRLTSPDLSDIYGVKGSASGTSKTINIKAPLSGDNDLSSLSVSGVNINFNPSTLNYSANVGKDISSVTINATKKDAGASVSGTGAKNLNYGINTFQIVVTAANGAKKTYTVKIIREDPRSTNNNLSSLKVSEGDISPKFKASTTTYTMTIPFKIDSIDIKAVAEDKKATVSITGNKNLPAETTTDVLIKVTAENGSVKTYTIKVTREKDPNKPKSGDNYLESLTTNTGLLSPVFNKEKLNYVIYVPYEIENIELSAVVSDKQFGVLEKNGPDKLNVGTNTFTFKVTTEDGTSRVYTVNVIRGRNLDDTSSSNALLKDIKITNGSLETKFKNNIFVYKYNKKKDTKIEPIPEDENTSVEVIKHEDVYTIILQNSNGETNVYTLIPKEKEANNLLLIALVVASIPLIGAGSFIGYKMGMKTVLNKIKSIKTKEVNESVQEETKQPKKDKNKKSKKLAKTS